MLENVAAFKGNVEAISMTGKITITQLMINVHKGREPEPEPVPEEEKPMKYFQPKVQGDSVSLPKYRDIVIPHSMHLFFKK